MNIFKQIITKSPKETKNIGKVLSRCLRKGDIVYLKGDLGSGKTTFFQGVALGFGVKGPVRSSSFIIVNEYILKKAKIYHMDLYRLSGIDIFDTGFYEYFDGHSICFIEWPENMQGKHISANYEVTLKWLDEGRRKIRIIKKANKSCMS